MFMIVQDNPWSTRIARRPTLTEAQEVAQEWGDVVKAPLGTKTTSITIAQVVETSNVPSYV